MMQELPYLSNKDNICRAELQNLKLPMFKIRTFSFAKLYIYQNVHSAWVLILVNLWDKYQLLNLAFFLCKILHIWYIFFCIPLLKTSPGSSNFYNEHLSEMLIALLLWFLIIQKKNPRKQNLLFESFLCKIVHVRYTICLDTSNFPHNF